MFVICPNCGTRTAKDDMRHNVALGVVCDGCNETELDCAVAGVPFHLKD